MVCLRVVGVSVRGGRWTVRGEGESVGVGVGVGEGEGEGEMVVLGQQRAYIESGASNDERVFVARP